jgi:hypothetical protein
LCAGIGAAFLALASQADATTVTFESFGGSAPLYEVPAGETLYTNFSSGLPSGATGDGSLYPANYGSIALAPIVSQRPEPAPPLSPTGSFSQ